MNKLLEKLAAEVENKEEKKPPFAKGEENGKSERNKEEGKKPSEESSGENKPEETPGPGKEAPAEESKEQEVESPEDIGGDGVIEGDSMAQSKAPAGIVAVMNFIQKNPNGGPDIHAMAEKEGISSEELMNSMYSLSMKAINFFRNGNMNSLNLDIASVDQNELQKGVQLEMQRHTPDESVAKKIALDNLAEIPDYYTRLQAMIQESIAESNAAAVPKKKIDTVNQEDAESQTDAPWNTPSTENY